MVHGKWYPALQLNPSVVYSIMEGFDVFTLHKDILHGILLRLPWRTLLELRLVCRAWRRGVNSMEYAGEIERLYDEGDNRVYVTFLIGPTVIDMTVSKVAVRYSDGSVFVDEYAGYSVVGQYTIMKIQQADVLALSMITRYLYIKDSRMKHMISIRDDLPAGSILISALCSHSYVSPWRFLANYLNKTVGYDGSILRHDHEVMAAAGHIDIPADLCSQRLLDLLD